MSKKLVSLFLAVLLVLAMAVPAMADGGTTTTGSITINNTVNGSTYTLYKIFDLTYVEPIVKDDKGNVTSPVAYSYTATGETDAFLAELNGANSPFTLTGTTTSGVYTVALKDGKDGKDISEFLNSCLPVEADEEAGTSVVESKLPASAGTASGTGNPVKVENLAFGYYFITTTTGAVVTIDSTIPDATVVDKNQEPTWDNEPENPGEGEDPNPGKVIIEENNVKTQVNSANYGEIVNFDIGVNATNAVGEDYVTYYYITDTLGDGFTLNKDSINVKVGSSSAEYSIHYSEDGQSFEIIIPWATIEKSDGKITAITPTYKNGDPIHVTYNATVNADGKDVVIAGDGNPNTANYTYVTENIGDTPDTPVDPDKPYDPENPGKPYDEKDKKTTTTYVYALAIKKIDAETEAPLADAHFSLKKGDTVIKANATSDAGVYEYAVDGTVTDFVTPENGILVIKGLDAGKYSFTETQAPAGYNMLPASKNPFDLDAVLAGTTTETITYTYYYDEDGELVDTEEEADPTKTETVDIAVFSVDVENSSGTELPSTGGIGTTIFYVVGSLLLVGAAVLLITKKRMSVNG